MSPTEVGKVFSRRVLFIEFIITVYFCPEVYLSVIVSKITIFFKPRTSSDARKHSKVSSNSDNDNKDEDDEPPAKRSLKSTSEATEERCASSKKSSVSSEDVYRIINDVFTEDQKKVLHHYHRCHERNCSSLGADEKQRFSTKKNKFQHEWLFEANVYCPKTGLRWLVFVEGEGMYCLICKKYKCTNQQNKSDVFNEKPSVR